MSKQIRAKITGRDGTTAYIQLPHHPATTTETAKSYGGMRRLCDLIDDYKGPMVNLDFNKDGILIGIEILIFEADRAVR